MARVLVVDDEAGIRSFLAEALESDGHEVAMAASAAEARALAERQGFAVVLTDLQMPGEDGVSLLRRLRSEQPEVEVIVLTAYSTVATAVEAMKLGAFDYLEKPVSSLPELRRLVARAVERRQLLQAREGSRRERAGEVALSHGDPAMGPVVESLRRVARTAATVLLLGESGTGKEVAARAVHRWSPRAEGPFVAINCAALSANLLESELFGHEKGAFTGAHAQQRGRLELAEGGTFFLDEVGELSLELQARLLRVLQERTFERVGGMRTLQADVRWVAATNQDLEAMVRQGGFRADLYHRIAVFPVRLPPLRERPADVVPIARSLLAGIATEVGLPSLDLSPDAERRLRDAPWPGNVRELRNVLERAAILADRTMLRADDLPLAPITSAPVARPSLAPPPHDVLALDHLERDAIARALAAEGGHRRRAAQRLGIGLRTLYEKIKRHGL